MNAFEAETVTPSAVLKRSIWPLVFLFGLPVFAFWFSGHASSSVDEQVITSYERQLAIDPQLSESDRAQAGRFLREHPSSSVCAQPTTDLPPQYVSSLESTCLDHKQFATMRNVALACIVLALLAVLVALGSAAAAFYSRSGQSVAFVLGWQSLRIVCTLMLVAQAGIATWLSYWLTALWGNVYVPKLIIIIGFLGLAAVASALLAMWRQPVQPLRLDGVLLDPAKATAFVERIRALCKELGTEPPKNIVAGIDDNFFVTESELHLKDRTLTGRSLFVSLSLLRMLPRAEADAILAHEMAHFSGGDTANSRDLLPALVSSDRYLNALGTNLFARPLFSFLLAYRMLFEFAFAGRRREREFRADATAAELTSGDAIARGLIRTNAYSQYRTRVERELLDANQEHSDLGIGERVVVGFLPYVQSDKLRSDLLHARMPHPFDSHPALADRIKASGSSLGADDFARVLEEPITETWRDGIEGFDELERAQWNVYETAFKDMHELFLAHRYGPDSDEERALVLKHFPPQEFAFDVMGTPITLTYERVQGGPLTRALPWSEIVSVKLAEATVLGQNLVIFVPATESGGSYKEENLKINVKKLALPNEFLIAFERFLNRSRMAAEHRKKREQAAAPRTG